MRSVRSGPIMLATAALFAATHAAGVLLATPVWRFAEVASLGALLLYALLNELPAPGWALPAALVVLLVEALWTLPPPSSAAGYGWQILRPADGIDTTSGFAAALAARWAQLVAVLVLLIAWRRSPRPSRGVLAGAVTAAILIIGYAAVSVTGIGLVVRAENTPYHGGMSVARAVTAASLAVLPALALGLAAVALAAVLAGNGRRLAAAGTSLLAFSALPHIDSDVRAAELPYRAAVTDGLFGADLLAPTLSMPRPLPALATALEMAAILLLVAGVAGWRRARA